MKPDFYIDEKPAWVIGTILQADKNLDHSLPVVNIEGEAMKAVYDPKKAVIVRWLY